MIIISGEIALYNLQGIPIFYVLKKVKKIRKIWKPE